MSKLLLSIFKKHKKDSVLLLLEESYNKISALESSAFVLNPENPVRIHSLTDIDKLKIKITTAAVARSNFIENNSNSKFIIITCALLSISGAVFSSYQNFDINRNNTLAKNEIFQMLSDGLDQAYQENFSKLEVNLVKQMENGFQELNKNIQLHVTKELDQQHEFFQKIYKTKPNPAKPLN